MGQFWKSQVCQVSLQTASLQLSLPSDELSSVDTCESGQLGLLGSQGYSLLLKSETVFVYKKQPSAQVAEAE